MKRSLVLASLFAIPSLAASQNAEDWELSRSVDEFTDEHVTTAMSVDYSTRQAVALKCSGKQLQAYFVFENAFSGSSASIRYRVDSYPAIAETWFTKSVPAPAAFSPNPESLARAFYKGRSIVIEATDNQGNSQRMRFSLVTANAPIAAVLSACNVSPIG